MIDLHSHLLPDIDDGSASMRASLRMAREAVAEGIDAMLMTPHHMNGQYDNPKADVVALTEKFQSMLDQEGISLQVFPSQEVRINGELIEALAADEILFADEGNRYLLLEFPDDDVPTFSEDMIFNLMQRGIMVQIAHPERNTKLMAQPEILYRLVERGAIAQVTASSYVGVFGKKVQKFAEAIVSHNLGHVFVSDVHDLPNRAFNMQAAFDKLRKKQGAEISELFASNAEAIIDGRPIQRLIPAPIVKRWLRNRF
ncbi:tyrosine-protein phosphatase [Leuconostoc lactis]|uniref:tyrosine-protein phosphatase n=1 Tax=Leuconostoc lactis TaxID=1246 RepID=UPI00021947D3|nr:CpsB/CapC family capsule biosynthesis tyrosine phosphatase [Leuconostoc lactis]GHC22992.1 tyrosine protein phosphatase [Leuconostoc lactis KCTC 3528 = DSM 20202]